LPELQWRIGRIEITLRDQLAICLVPNNPVAHAAIAMARANFNPLLAKTEISRPRQGVGPEARNS